MKKLEMMEWSLNLSSSTNAKIPEWVFEAMKIQREETKGGTLPDIIFLNEVVTCNDSCSTLLKKLEMEKYRVICSNNNHGNQVAIALNSDFKIKNIVYQMPYIQAYYAPDFLHVEAMYNGKVYNFIALRIRINSNKLTDEEFFYRNIQFECYKNYISKLSNVISAGDFNHARIIGDENDTYDNSQIKYRLKQVVQRFYNYQMIKYEIKLSINDKKQILTPQSNSRYKSLKGILIEDNLSSVGIKLYHNKALGKDVFIYPCISHTKRNDKLDHFVVSESIKEISSPYYDWIFLQNFLDQENSEPKDYFDEGKVKVKKGYPDHAQLRASITIV